MSSNGSTYILGVSAFYHDSAAALIKDGEVIAAGSEERFTRKKGDSDFPKEAVAFCLREAGIGLGDIKYVGFYDKPLLKFERILETYLARCRRALASSSRRDRSGSRRRSTRTGCSGSR